MSSDPSKIRCFRASLGGHRPQTRWQRGVVGLVSAAPCRPGAWYVQQLRDAGFARILREDITESVIFPVIARTRERIAEDPQRLRSHGLVADQVVRRLIDAAERAYRRGRLRYELFAASSR